MKQRIGVKKWIITGGSVLFGTFIIISCFLPWCRNIAALSANPDGLFESMVYMFIHSRKIWINGTVGTLTVSFLGTVIGFCIAILLTLQRTAVSSEDEPIVHRIGKVVGQKSEILYVTIIRGTPMMVQACIIYYGGFAITRAIMKNATITEINRTWSFFAAALITVSLNTSAYLAEVLRGGVEAIDQGQTEAAFALGLTRWQTMRKVVFPQAIRNCLPAIGNELINNIKGTSVLNVIGFVELMFATGTVAGFYYKYLAAYCNAAIIYLCLTVSLTKLLNFTMRKVGLMTK
ncbi:MAG: amino acid ABC transporter permease [Lachnospiraceae bacterium]|nr:amino acid ABC transporter permease [Lachnospiraceae bacterium]